MRPIVLFLLSSLLAVPVFAQKDKILEIQRDVALLQNEVRSMKSSMDEKFAGLTVLVQQTLDNANKSNTSLAILDKTLGDKMKEQQSALNAPVAGVNTKVDQMTTEFALMKESVSELSDLIKKLQSQITDIKNAVSTINAPAPPAPAASTVAPESNTPPPGLNSESLYTDALSAKNGGQTDFAFKQFKDYLRWFPDGGYAPNSQYHIGEMLASQGKYDDAVKAFDLVIEKYGQNSKTLDAHLAKGKALAKSGQRTAAVNEFRSLISNNPDKGQASLARQELKELGMPYVAPTATPRKKR